MRRWRIRSCVHSARFWIVGVTNRRLYYHFNLGFPRVPRPPMRYHWTGITEITKAMRMKGNFQPKWQDHLPSHCRRPSSFIRRMIAFYELLCTYIYVGGMGSRHGRLAVKGREDDDATSLNVLSFPFAVDLDIILFIQDNFHSPLWSTQCCSNYNSFHLLDNKHTKVYNTTTA